MKKINKKVIVTIALLVVVAILELVYYNYNIAKNNRYSEISATPETEVLNSETPVEEPEDEFIDIDQLETEEIEEESEQENENSSSDTNSNTSNTRFLYFK